MKYKADFNPIRCRAELARFNDHEIHQCVNVLMSHDESKIRSAAGNPDLARQIFWTQEWLAAERIESKREAFTRLRDVLGLRRQQQNARSGFLSRVNLALGFAVCLGQTAIWFAA